MKRKSKPLPKTPALMAVGGDIATPRSRPVELHRIEAVVVVILTQRCEGELGEATVQRFRAALEAKNLLGHVVSDTDVFDMTLNPFLYDSQTDSVPTMDAMRPQATSTDGAAQNAL